MELKFGVSVLKDMRLFENDNLLLSIASLSWIQFTKPLKLLSKP
jgi:hypothetical protein